MPYNWEPRNYQMGAWEYLQNGGKLAELIWHRRSGKDELSLHWTMVAAFQRVANYWHMLPEYAQARKAIWGAINPHTGKRRIDEAFPVELRETTREHEMQIVFKNGSSWQLVGSDRYNGLVGSPPAGVVYSEWALTNPAARGFIRPIMAENNGWQIFITTPRSRNHAYRTFMAAKQNRKAYAELLTANDTGILSAERLQEEKQGYIDTFGADEGEALFEQEYYCSFDAAILGSFYGKEIRQLEEAGRILHIDYDPALPVFTAWDLGYRDDTAIWFYQVVRGEIRVIDFYAVSGANIADLADVVMGKPYRYVKHNLPHDARAKTLASGGKSVIEQLAHHLGLANLAIVPELSVQDGIQAVRAMLPRVWFDANKCADGIEALKQYQREYDEDKKTFRQTPRHDWCSHPADAFRMLAIAWRSEPTAQRPPESRTLIVGPENQVTLNDMWAVHQQQSRRARI